MTERRLICPKCGDLMNHHADKLIHATAPGEPASLDAALGGAIEETHACPGCGAVAARTVE